jgi:hypothetical protein
MHYEFSRAARDVEGRKPLERPMEPVVNLLVRITSLLAPLQ